MNGKARATSATPWPCTALYPKDRYKDGHPDLANSLNNLGFLLQAQGCTARRGYSSVRWPCTSALPQGTLPAGPPRTGPQPEQPGLPAPGPGLLRRGAGYPASPGDERALYPKARYPEGHPELASSLNNLGCLLQAQGSYGEARGYLERALAMSERSTPRIATRKATPTWPAA